MSKFVMKGGRSLIYLNIDATSKVTKHQSQNLIEYSEEIKLETSSTWGKRDRLPMMSLEVLLT
jgi:hypothetical protein